MLKKKKKKEQNLTYVLTKKLVKFFVLKGYF